jgi:transcriptional regulator with XRE-family HTH domain
MRLSGQALCQAVGAAIRDRRKVLKMTLETLAKRIGISLGYLSQIERGEVTISLETLYRASLIMGVRMTDFLQEIEPQ